MSDRTIPRSLRLIEGFEVHSLRLINEAGESTFVKFHWRPKLGLQSTIWDETVKIAGADPDFHRRDMFEAINSPKCPFGNHQRDGHMQMGQPVGRVAYEPNFLSENSPR
nr:catalase [uncultured Desulfobacter sp.]